MEKIRKYWNRPSRSAYVFIAPSIILLILFNIIPLIMAFGLSFFDYYDESCYIRRMG